MNYLNLFTRKKAVRSFALPLALFLIGLIAVVISSLLFKVKDTTHDFRKNYWEIKADFLAESALEIEFARFLTFVDQISRLGAKKFNLYYKRDFLKTSYFKFQDDITGGKIGIKDFQVVSDKNGSIVLKIVGFGKVKRVKKMVTKVLKVDM